MGVRKLPRHRCPRRDEVGVRLNSKHAYGEEDEWKVHRKGGPYTCSYCGSVHPDDFMNMVLAHKEIIPTDKSYKLYIRGGESGQDKFYTRHLSTEQGEELWKLITQHRVNWGYPGYPYTPLYLPGPSSRVRPK